MKHRWIRAWALQIAEALTAGLIAALCQGAVPAVRVAALWGLVPLAGLVSACQAVRRGLNNYLAWIAPGVGLYAANRLVWGYSPSAGAALMTALLSLVGAAAGQVIIQRRDGGRRARRTRS